MPNALSTGTRRFVAALRRLPAAVLLALALVIGLVTGGGVATAKGGIGGGTAKPPPLPKPPVPASGPVVRSFPAVSPPMFTGDPTHQALHQFAVTGFIQDATVSGAECPGLAEVHWGGTVRVNGLSVVVPCNTVIQMPAATLTWRQFVQPEQPAAPASPVAYLPTTLAQLAGSPGTYPSFEITVLGNTVVDRHVAGLVYVSQQSLNQGQGVITSIDHATGRLHVGSAVPAPGQTVADQAVLELNDPKGRFGLAHSVDPRFSVDDENPTVHAATGYPMCIPRTTPVLAADGTVASGDDPLCPQANRPRVVASHCRDFVDDGLGANLPKGGNLFTPVGTSPYCGHFVMPPLPASGTAAAGSPDPTQQAPFEVGDYVTWSGTLLPAAAGTSGSPAAAPVISTHTLQASVGIFTSHGTLPSYQAIGQFGISSADPNPRAVNGATQESVDRMFLEAETTDVTTPVDIYLPDVDPVTGVTTYRWITPFEMTSESNPEVTPDGPGAFIGGGILTQFNGPQSQRVRIRARKAPVGLLASPPRTALVVARTLCNPDTTGTPSSVSENSTVNNIATDPGCLTRDTVANGLHAGRYQAPNFAFIFPENTQMGDPVVPFNFWDLGFLSNGEGAATGGQGPLTPRPW